MKTRNALKRVTTTLSSLTLALTIVLSSALALAPSITSHAEGEVEKENLYIVTTYKTETVPSKGTRYTLKTTSMCIMDNMYSGYATCNGSGEPVVYFYHAKGSISTWEVTENVVTENVGFGDINASAGGLFTMSNGSVWNNDEFPREYMYNGSEKRTISHYFYANFPIFSTKEEVDEYFATGDDSKRINPPEIEKDNTLALAGFKCDKSIQASWTDYVCGDLGISTGNLFVNIKATYAVEGQKTDSIYDCYIPYNDMSFSRNYQDFIPAGECPDDAKLTLKFTLIYYKSDTGVTCKGRTKSVYFNIDGTVDSVQDSLIVEDDENGTDNDGGLSNYNPSNPTMKLALTGFECDSTIRARWLGYACNNDIDPNNITVNVSAMYFLELNAGEEEQDYSTPPSQKVKYKDMGFEKAYSDYMANNPYAGRIKLILKFTPIYYDAKTGTTYNGEDILVYFDKSGSVESIDLPEGTIENDYGGNSFNGEFYLKNFTATSEFHNWDDSYIHCLWNGSSIDGIVNYNYSEIKVQICAFTRDKSTATSERIFSWIDYDVGDIVSIKSNRLDFNLSDVQEYCQTFGLNIYDSADQWEGVKIRVTPYYKTDNEYINGKSVDIALSTFAGIDSLEQSTNDAINGDGGSWDDLEEDYFNKDDDNNTDGSTNDSILDDIFKPDSGINTNKYLTELPLNFISAINGFIISCGQFPAMFATVFSFLPATYTDMFVFALIVVIFLRLLGR